MAARDNLVRHAIAPRTGAKPGASFTARRVTASTLNKAPMSSAAPPVSRARAASTCVRLFRRRVALQRVRALQDPQLAQEGALLDRPVDAGVGGRRRARERGEIDMGGEVGLARLGQRIDELMRLDRLQGLAEGGADIAVINHQRRAVLGDDARGDPGHQALRGGADFENRAVLRLGLDIGLDLFAQPEGQFALPGRARPAARASPSAS